MAGADSVRPLKSQNEVMGIGASSAAGLETPFPIDAAMEKDLVKLSSVVSRLLNKPDLYDLNNLARPGACGDYAVFLKDKLEKRLMPFITDVSSGGITKTMSVVYQNPLKAFDKVETRKEVCQSLANTMVRLVSIVVACLASIQFESVKAREAAGLPAATGTVVAPSIVQQQRGGGPGDAEIVAWLFENKFLGTTALPAEDIATIQSSRRTLVLYDSTGTAAGLGVGLGFSGGRYGVPETTITLLLNRTPESDGRAYAGYIQSSQAQGYLKAYLMKPIQLSTLRALSVLPIHVVDNTGLTWMAGALYNGRFLSFGQGQQRPEALTEILTRIFRKAQAPTGTEFGGALEMAGDVQLEPRASLELAERVFRLYRRSTQQEGVGLLQQALAPHLSSALGAYYPGALGGPQAMGFGGLGDLISRRPLGGLGGLGGLGPYGYGPYGRPGELAAGEYVVPPPVAKAILTTFRKHSGEIGAANNPAQIRATLLAGQVLRDRTIQTRICQDPYWISTTMASIYPWAALQFLCIQDYKSLGGTAAQPITQITPVVPTATTAAQPVAPAPTPAPIRPLTTTSRPKLSKEWTEFVSGLRSIYVGDKLPTITVLGAARDGEGQALEDLRFVDINKVPGCTAPGVSPRARFQEIQNGVLRLQGLYEEHSKAVWNLLNSLIFMIEDPDTKTDMVRLHPQMFTTEKSTARLIEDKAEEARTLLADYYLEIEKVYTSTIRNMRVLS